MLSAEPKAKADNTYRDLDYWGYRKSPKISPGLIFFKGPFWGAYFWWGLYSERLMYGGKFAFQNRLGQLIIGRKCTIFALFYFVFELQFTSTSPPGGLYSEGWCNRGFFFFFALSLGGLYLEGLIRGGAYFRNFIVSQTVNTMYNNRAVFTWLWKVIEELVWFWFYYALWLASVFTLVLVLRQSSENRSNNWAL